jgi:nucleotide-binding universal stress UspA family protein
MKKLLAIVNDPVNSDDFVDYSIRLAMDFNLNVDLMYIQNPAIFNFGTDAATSTAHPVQSYNEIDIARLETDRDNALKSITSKIDQFTTGISPGISVEAISETGSSDIIIDQMVSDNKADMLIVENYNENRFWFFDSSNTNLVLKTDCPAWVIPMGIKYRPYEKIVYATDYNEADLRTIKNLIRLTGKLSPEITALHIMKSGDFEEKTMSTGFKQMVRQETGHDKISFASIIDDKHKDPGVYINEYAISVQADLIVLLKENKAFIERIFKPGSTREVLKNARLPVLIYHE